jgi:hypothetical protein
MTAHCLSVQKAGMRSQGDRKKFFFLDSVQTCQRLRPWNPRNLLRSFLCWMNLRRKPQLIRQNSRCDLFFRPLWSRSTIEA